VCPSRAPMMKGPMIPPTRSDRVHTRCRYAGHTPHAFSQKLLLMNPHDSDRPGRSDSKTSTSHLGCERTNTLRRDDSSSSQNLSLDTIFDILSHSYRRQILSYLSQTEDDLATIADLVTVISKHESESETSVQRTQDDAVGIALHHNHLPKLADAGLIEFDTRSETIRYWGHPKVEKHLSVLDAME
jgi:hypothetical protein